MKLELVELVTPLVAALVRSSKVLVPQVYLAPPQVR